MLPVLKVLADGNERTPAEVRAPIAAEFQMSEADLEALLPSGRQSTFNNRVAWALGYLKQAKLLESPRRSVYRITARGEDVLKAPPPRIDIAYLDRYSEFVAFRSATGPSKLKSLDPGLQKTMTERIPVSVDGVALTPDEQVRVGAASLRENVAARLLERVKQVQPALFENLVVELLVAMGYGGSHEDAAKVVGRSGDGGIDGIIKEDRLEGSIPSTCRRSAGKESWAGQQCSSSPEHFKASEREKNYDLFVHARSRRVRSRVAVHDHPRRRDAAHTLRPCSRVLTR